MEQAQHWMWMKRKHILMKSHLQASMNDSWEEQAFAEDAAGLLGGCIWPPRSYSCSFCKREFRSAQALGGHMNVHRRDRARLKQSLSPHSEVLHYQNHNQNLCESLGAQYPSQGRTLDYNPYPNSSLSFVASPLSPSRVSASSTQENFSEHTFVSPYSSSIVQQYHKRSPYSPPSSLSNSRAVKLLSISDSNTKFDKNPRKEESICLGHNNYVETDLSVGLKLVVPRSRPSTGSGCDEAISCKRPKTAVSSLPFFLKPCSNDRYPLQSELIGLKTSSMEDLDLELRLGDPPKVK